MAKHSADPDAPKKPKKRAKVTMGTWIALGLLIPVSVMTFNLFRTWKGVRDNINRQEQEHAVLVARNTVLSKVYENLQNRQFQVCNRTAETVTISWLSVALQDGKTIQSFDSGRCQAWKDQVLASGENKVLTLNSPQAGCNWNGSVVHYAMRYTRESEELSNTINFVGQFKGYDRDCHTIQ